MLLHTQTTVRELSTEETENVAGGGILLTGLGEIVESADDVLTQAIDDTAVIFNDAGNLTEKLLKAVV